MNPEENPKRCLPPADLVDSETILLEERADFVERIETNRVEAIVLLAAVVCHSTLHAEA